VDQRVGRVDGLVNGAGWDQIQPFLENPPEMWDRVIAVNLMGAVRLTRGVLPRWSRRPRARSQHIERCRPGWEVMGETRLRRRQGRADRIYQSLARELARHRITSIASAPARPTLRCSTPNRAHEGSADPGDPVSPDRSTDRDRTGGDVFLERPIGLHHREVLRRQRRIDDGGLGLRALSNQRRRNARDAQLFTGDAAAVLLLAVAAPAWAQMDPGAAANVRQSEQYEQALRSNPGFRAQRMKQECGDQRSAAASAVRRLVRRRRRAASRRRQQ